MILELKNVGYRYSDAEENDFVLKDINLEFAKGKVYAIKGKSGSGKTTLLSLLAGLERPTTGEIIYEGQSLAKKDLDKYRNTNIGIIFQSYNLLPHMSASENIILSMDISKLAIKDKQKKALELLERVGLTKEKGARRVLKLSGGEQQRVAIARSLSYNPDLILADEPTGNLDKETEEEIIEIFQNLAKEENKCIIIVTHSENVAQKADEVFELSSKKKKTKAS